MAGGAEAADDAPDATSLLGTARRTLEAQSGVDPELGELAARLEEAATLVGDVAAELSALPGQRWTPTRPGCRRSTSGGPRCAALTRKYADDVDGVIAWAERARDPAGRAGHLRRAARRAGPGAAAAGRRGGRAGRGGCRAARQEAAVRFADAGDRRAGRAGHAARPDRGGGRCPGRPARAEPTLTVDGVECGVGPDGADEVELRLLAHPGAPALPLQKGASGGELSRVMLAIEVVFAGAGGPPTLVFDEVDAGVGGQAAVEIGRRLARLARSHQVLVVTHLPQVAAFADRHLVVAKDTGGAVTTSGVRVVRGHRAGPGAGPDAGRPARLGSGHRARRGAAGGGRPTRRRPLTAAIVSASTPAAYRVVLPW